MLSVEKFLEDRQASSSYSVVELGHRECPVVYGLHNLQNGRSYTGVEAWLRDPSGSVRSALTELQKFYSGTNVRFLDIDVGGDINRDEESEDYGCFIGEYQAATPLPGNQADEVVVSNIFGDPHIAYRNGSSVTLLREIERLLKSDGLAVIRETTTPHRATWSFTPERIATAGLKETVRVMQNAPVWQLLETSFSGSSDIPFSPSDSFYAFLQKK